MAGVLSVGVVLAVTATGCGVLPGGGGDDGAGGAGPISGLLADIPDTAGNRQQLQVTDHAGLARAVGVEWPLGDDADGTDAFSQALLAGGEVLVPSTLLEQLQAADDWRRELGFGAGDVTAAAETGVPPSVLSVFRTTAEPSAIADAVTADGTWSADLRTAERNGAAVYSWGSDPQAVNTDRTSPVRRLGQGGVLAVDGKGVVLWSTDPAAVDAGLDLGSGGEGSGSLADNDTFAALARVLDDQGCYQAILSDRAPVLDPLNMLGPRADPAIIERLRATLDAGPALPPYRALGIGNAIDGDTGQGYVVFAFATGSDGEAQAVADAFPLVVAEGTSATTNQPWSDLMTVRRATTEGAVAVVTVDTERLSVGLEAYQRLDTLLATRVGGAG
ncbi:MAG: hypothetical protein R2761_10645 [Acidimicrobiales bacterium]